MDVALVRRRRPRARRRPGDGDCVGGRPAEPECERYRTVIVVDPGAQHDVPVRGGVVGRGKRMRGVELNESVAGRAGETGRRGRERPVGAQGERGRHRVVAVVRVAHGVRIARNEGIRRGRRVVGAAVGAAAAAVAVHGRVEPDVQL